MASDNGKAAGDYVLFVSKSSGYELAERKGDPPAPGSTVEEGETTFRVAKLAPSPLPGDDRVCAYLEPA